MAILPSKRCTASHSDPVCVGNHWLYSEPPAGPGYVTICAALTHDLRAAEPRYLHMGANHNILSRIRYYVMICYYVMIWHFITYEHFITYSLLRGFCKTGAGIAENATGKLLYGCRAVFNMDDDDGCIFCT